MDRIVKIEKIEKKLIELRDQKVLVDSDVADIYGVATKRINEAVKNNPDRFPEGYYFEVDQKIKNKLVENFDRFKKVKHSTVSPKAFTEKGLYMLATILKSEIATQTTISIIETFVKVRSLRSTVKILSQNPPKIEQQSLIPLNAKEW
jgi:5-bromo-4-chloroindolyl phosphate hydrolysis protein